MHARLAGALGATVALVLALAPAGDAATTPTATRWIDAQEGYSLVLPDDWYVIPRTQAAIRQEIASLKAAKNTSLEQAFDSILKSPQALSELTKYRFQAFLWPPLDSLVPTEVSIQVVTGTHSTAAQLPTIGATYAQSLKGAGAKISGPTVLKLPAGRSEFIEGTVANGGGVSTGLELYLLVHDSRVYALSFEIGAAFLRTANVETAFRAIADAFSFSTTS